MTHNDFTDRDLLLKAAILYYEQNMTQEQIAKIIGISRPAVSKILQNARDQHLVEFFVKDFSKRTVELEIEIQKKYNLKTVKVVSNRFNRTTEAIEMQVGFLSAQYLQSIVKDVSSIGIGWGNAVSKFVDETDYFLARKLTVTPLVGGLGLLNLDIHANNLASKLATKLGCQYSTFYAPVIAASAKEAKELKESELVSSCIEAAKNVDVAFIGVGNDVESSTWRKLEYISESETKELTKAGAIGDVVADFFDRDGQRVHTGFSNRLIGVTIDDLKKIPNVVAMAVGTKKTQSVKVLLENKIINALMIDQDLAEQIG
ncbi:sugar-binding transcriptional regulator [Xylocopilactobacillus apicola]|uniref:Sugar-binding protein n=1 Tax=Xylocopilactobacillus apicola TaxID=2932184 RepID=A0AAU9DCQ6_9LACO|nr:sugar-binding domain-containing protein [Xylocopilactobacillus apicola]BDR57570.1 sugar-binding protein [Xylocopilactobacillus apicola]